MKDYNGNQNPFSEEKLQQWTPKETVEAIQNVSKKIGEYSSKMRETMKALRESNVIPEMAEAIRDASFAVRDTVNDINETTKELKKRGIFVDTASAIETTWKSTEDSIATVKQMSSDAAKASPHTAKALHTGLDIIKKEPVQNSEKVFKELKTKVGVT